MWHNNLQSTALTAHRIETVYRLPRLVAEFASSAAPSYIHVFTRIQSSPIAKEDILKSVYAKRRQLLL